MHTNTRLHILACAMAVFTGLTACSSSPSTASGDTSLARDLQMAKTNPATTVESTSTVERTSIAPASRPIERVRHTSTHTRPGMSTSASYGHGQAAPSAQNTGRASSYPMTPVTPATHDVKQTKRDAAVGAGAGAILGAITSKNKVKGGIIGGILGGVLGGVVGNNVDKKRVPDTTTIRHYR